MIDKGFLEPYNSILVSLWDLMIDILSIGGEKTWTQEVVPANNRRIRSYPREK